MSRLSEGCSEVANADDFGSWKNGKQSYLQIQQQLRFNLAPTKISIRLMTINLINIKPNVTLITSKYQIRCVYGICGWTILKSELKVPRTSFVAMLVPDDLTSCNQTFVP